MQRKYYLKIYFSEHKKQFQKLFSGKQMGEEIDAESNCLKLNM